MSVLLLSGGIASACVAAWRRPDRCLFVDYGQAPAAPARIASWAVARKLGLPWVELVVDCTSIKIEGSRAQQRHANGQVERWPYRNQLLVTLAAAWARGHGERVLMIASGRADADLRMDSSHLFWRRADQLVRMQAGGLRISLPALGLSLAELLVQAGPRPDLLGLTYCCEVAAEPCGACSGCRERAVLLAASARGRLPAPARQR